MNIVLIGYRGSGKTTIGRLVAGKLRWPFYDSDEQIVKRAGKTIKQIFDEHGELAFRDGETDVVRYLMKKQEHVISLGGGAVMREENRAVIQRANPLVVYLRCDAETLWKRIEADEHTHHSRPALTELHGLAEVKRLLTARAPGYLALKPHVIDVSTITPESAATKIANLLP